MLEETVRAYNEAIFDTDRDKALDIVHHALAHDVTPEDIVFKVVIPAIEQMMTAISENLDANLAQHFLTAQIASEVTEAMLPLFKEAPQSAGKVVLGTAQGDMHSLGRRIVSGCLKSTLVEVVDLGINVAPERFVDEAVAEDAQVIGISAMMVHTAQGENGCLKVRQILRQRGLEDRIKIAVGGAPYRFNSELYREVGADAWAPDGVTAAKVIAGLIEEVRQ
jgi:methylmalonyl-CoA mutase cobalamin-binding domain/chain